MGCRSWQYAAAGGGAKDAVAPVAEQKNGGAEPTRGRGRTAPMGRRRRREAKLGQRVRPGDSAVKQAVLGVTRGWHGEASGGDDGV
jgi:hypothetical protein